MRRTRKLTRLTRLQTWQDTRGNDVLCASILGELWPATVGAPAIRATVRTAADITHWKPGERLFELCRGNRGLWAIHHPDSATPMAYCLHTAAERILQPFLAKGPCRVLVRIQVLDKATTGA